MLLKLAVVSCLRIPRDPSHTLMIGLVSARGVMRDGVVLGYCRHVPRVRFPHLSAGSVAQSQLNAHTTP